MSFSAEMKDFLSAAKTTTDILASKTDEDYKKAQTDSLTKKTARENDPDQLALQDQQARANLAATSARTGLTQEQIKSAPVSRNYTAAITDRIKNAANAQPEPPPSSGLLPPPMAPGAAVGGGVAPVAPALSNTMAPAVTDNYAEGGAIPDYVPTPRSDPRPGAAVVKGAKQTLREEKPVTVMEDIIGRFNEAKGQDNAVRDAIREKAFRDLKDHPEVYQEKRYAEGGAIPDTENDADEDDTPTDISARARGGGGTGFVNQQGLDGVVSPKLIHDAVKGAYAYGIKAAGLSGGVRSPRHQQAARAIAEGQGGLTQQEMDAARNAVDPQGKLTDSQRNMAALGSVYQYWANKGEPERAQKVAFQMLQNFRMASQRYAAIAAHAAEQGNMDLATKAAVKAYANVPDGRDMQLTVNPDGRILYHYTDESGKTITKGLATPQELASSAMGLARGGFDQAILSAAGVREEQAKGTSKGNGGSNRAVADMKGTQELLDDPMTKAQEMWQKKNEGKQPDEAYWSDVRDTATHLMQQNPKATPKEAIEAAVALHTTKGGSPAPDFSTTSKDGTNTIKLAGGNTMNLGDNEFDAAITKRAARIKAAQAAESAPKPPSRMDQAIEGAKRVGGAIADDARLAGRQLSDMVPTEMKERLKDVPDVADRFTRDYLGPLTDPKINYGTLTTAIGKGVQSAVEQLVNAARSPQPQQQPGAIPATPDDQTNPQLTGP